MRLSVLITTIILFHSKESNIITEGMVLSSQRDMHSPYIFHVCENKDCLKQFPPAAGVDGLFQVISDLIHPKAVHIVLQRSGCLSQCGKGPNICVSSKLKSSNTFFGVKDAYVACGILQDECNMEISPLLLAAVEVMSQAHRVSSLDKKIQLLSSVISQLSTADDLNESMAMLHATSMRANVYLETVPQNVSLALADAHKCANLISSIESFCIENDCKHILQSSSVLFTRAYRTLADAEEASGNYNEAKNAISQWIRLNPSFRIKAEKDLERLNQLLNQK